MAIASSLLFWLHLSALALGGAAVFGVPAVDFWLSGPGAGQEAAGFALMKQLTTMGRAAYGVLIVTGPLIAWLRFGGFAGFNAWFDAKMVFVVLLLITMIAQAIFARRTAAGDAKARGMLRQLEIVNIAVLLLIVLCAVFAFN